jgi:hypothetical protein
MKARSGKLRANKCNAQVTGHVQGGGQYLVGNWEGQLKEARCSGDSQQQQHERSAGIQDIVQRFWISLANEYEANCQFI